MRNLVCGNCFREFSEEGVSCPGCGWDPAENTQKCPHALRTGSILNGRYILGKALGQGGFGITYLAWDIQTDQKVAIKEFFPETMVTRTGDHNVTPFAGQRQENFAYGMQCFLSEARNLAQFLGVKNIVGIHSYFEENGTAYFAMDYVEGISLKEYLQGKGGRISWEEASKLLLPIMDALIIVHGKGMIHRDIAPDNIYITESGDVKLLDFGAARYSLGDKSQSLDVMLKVGYAPKEQYIRHGRQGPYTDMYSLAATFYFAITGEIPPESIARMDEDTLILPSRMGISIPEKAEAALEKALSIHPGNRFSSMAEFKAAVEQTLQEEENRAALGRKTEENTSQKPQKKKKYRILIPVLLLICTAFAIFLYLPEIKASNAFTYAKAVYLAQTGNHKDAYSLFEHLDGYHDAEDRCLKSKYHYAKKLADEGKFLEANTIFSQLGNYQDSLEQYQESKYRYAASLADRGEYADAYSLFVELGDYKDAEAQQYKYQWYTCAVGSTVTFGQFEQDANIHNGSERIRWFVLEKEAHRVLLISESVLTYELRGDSTWEDSDLRRWLNSEFLETAFDEAEQEKILFSEIITTWYKDSGIGYTTDQIFLLSAEEYEEYYIPAREKNEEIHRYRDTASARIIGRHPVHGTTPMCW